MCCIAEDNGLPLILLIAAAPITVTVRTKKQVSADCLYSQVGRVDRSRTALTRGSCAPYETSIGNARKSSLDLRCVIDHYYYTNTILLSLLLLCRFERLLCIFYPAPAQAPSKYSHHQYANNKITVQCHRLSLWATHAHLLLCMS